MKYLFIFLLFLSIFSKKKTSKIYQFENLDVKNQLEMNQTLKIVETQTLNFSEPFKTIYKPIPIHNNGRNDGIKILKVCEIINNNQIEYLREKYDQDYYYTEKDGITDYGVYLYFPIANGIHKYEISYQIYNPIQILSPNYYQLFLKIIPSNHYQPIFENTNEIILPEHIDVQNILFFLNKLEITPKIERNRDKIKFKFKDIEKNDMIEVKIIFNSSINIGVPKWQLRQEFTEAYLNPFFKILAIILLFIPILKFVIDREPIEVKNKEDHNEIIPPSFVEIIIRNHSSFKNIVATLIELCRKGYIKIKQVESDWKIILIQKDIYLKEYESFLISKLFENSQQKSYIEFLEKFKEFKKFDDILYETLMDMYLIKYNPYLIACKYSVLGIIIILFGMISIFTLHHLMYPINALFYSFAALFTSFFCLYTAGEYNFNILTGKGVHEKRKILELKQHIERVHLGLVEIDSLTYDMYIPYMINFRFIFKPEYYDYTSQEWFEGSPESFSRFFNIIYSYK